MATESSRAGQLAGSVRNNPGEAISNLNAAVEYVSSLPNVNSSRVASLGRCLDYSALKTVNPGRHSQLEAVLDANGITNQIYIYEGVGHAFVNPSGDN